MASATFASLPDEVLAMVFQHLRLCERHRNIPLVCTRWRQVANTSPQLLRIVDISLLEGGQHAARRAEALCCWLIKHAAPHVQQLGIAVDEDQLGDGMPQVAVATAAALGVLGVSGALTTLRLEGQAVHRVFWASEPRSLRHLAVIHENSLNWDILASALPCLEELCLEGNPLSLVAPACLPPSLTRLHLEDLRGDLPKQVSALTRLRALSMARAECSSQGYAPLARLPALGSLSLCNCRSWPACLSRLTGLEALVLDDSEYMVGQLDDSAVADVVHRALPRLRRLTSLVLDCGVEDDGPPPALASLTTGLRSFCWLDYNGGGALPGGPWLTGLRQLAVRLPHCIVDSWPALSAAQQLQTVGVFCHPTHAHLQPYTATMRCALRRVLGLPSLRRVVVAGPRAALGEHCAAIVAAQRTNPAVCIECHDVDLNQFLALFGYDVTCGTSREHFLRDRS